jgi:hypothetical protein
MRAGRALRRARPRLINLMRGETGGFYLSVFAILAPCVPAPESFLPQRHFVFGVSLLPSCPSFPASLPFLMAPLPPLVIVDPYAWERSTVTRLALGDLIRPLPTPARSVERHSNGSGSGRRARRSARGDTASAASGGTRSTGCVSSRGSLLRGSRSTHPRRRKRRKRRKRPGAEPP